MNNFEPIFIKARLEVLKKSISEEREIKKLWICVREYLSSDAFIEEFAYDSIGLNSTRRLEEVEYKFIPTVLRKINGECKMLFNLDTGNIIEAIYNPQVNDYVKLKIIK